MIRGHGQKGDSASRYSTGYMRAYSNQAIIFNGHCENGRISNAFLKGTAHTSGEVDCSDIHMARLRN